MRRKRHQRAAPERNMRFSERDLATLELVQFFSVIRLPHLAAICAHDSNQYSRIRLLQDNGYVDKFQWRRSSYEPDLVRLTKHGEETLRQNHRYVESLTRFRAKQKNQKLLEHTVMISDIVAHLYHACKNAGYTFLFMHDILDMNQEDPSVIHGTPNVKPDYICGIDYGGKVIIYAIEADRGTMPIVRRGDGNSVMRKMQAYAKMYKEHGWQTLPTAKGKPLPNLVTMLVTSHPERMETILKAMSELPITNPFILNHIPVMGAFTACLKMDMSLWTPWKCANGTMFDITKV